MKLARDSSPAPSGLANAETGCITWDYHCCSGPTPSRGLPPTLLILFLQKLCSDEVKVVWVTWVKYMEWGNSCCLPSTCYKFRHFRVEGKSESNLSIFFSSGNAQVGHLNKRNCGTRI